jgi:hypothetical protein
MLLSCSSPLNYPYKMSMTAYAHRMPRLFITKNNYYSGKKVFIYDYLKGQLI